VHADVQRPGSVVKMGTVLGECTYKEQGSVVRFLWAKGLNARDIHTEMFPLYGGNCLTRKAVHNWVANLLMTKKLKQRCRSG
jgi:hypothetical protein